MSSNLQMDDMPWLQPRAVDWMQQYLIARQARVFEWGAGGSTLWFARNTASVLSVEHSRQWHGDVLSALQKQNNVALIVALTWIPEGGGYWNFIHEFAFTFDLILVDGILRNECIAAALPHLLPNGMLVVDNTERADEYAEGLALLKDWYRQDFSSENALAGDWTTSIFIKP